MQINTKCLDFNRRDCSVHYVKTKSYCRTCFKHYCVSDEYKKELKEKEDAGIQHKQLRKG